MKSTTLTSDAYYQDDMYLSQSSLSNFVTFDFYGNPIYNLVNFLSPSKPQSSAIEIGSIVDKVLTEGLNFEEEYSIKMDKTALQNQCEIMGIEYKKDATIPVLMDLLKRGGYKFGKELTPSDYQAVSGLIESARNFQYDGSTTLMQYIAECDNQMIITNDELMIKGKFDFFNPKRGRISDLKTTGNLDMVFKNITKGGQANIHDKYVRQLAFYRQLAFLATGEYYDCELIIMDYTGKKALVRMTHNVLDAAWAQIEKDLDVLYSMLKGNEYAMVLDYAPYIDAVLIPEAPVAQEIKTEDEEITL